MSGLLGTKAGIEADLNLILHLAILILMIAGFTFARRKKFEVHEKFMLAAIVLAGVSFFAWMAPSYIKYLDVVVSEFYTLGVIITNIHVLLGVISGILAVYIVLRMKFDLPERFRVKRVKRLMRATFTLWLLALVFGLSFYIWYYVLKP